MKNFQEYARRMATKGYIVDVDGTDLKSVAAELQKIDVNLRQILRYVDTLGPAYATDAAELRQKMKENHDMLLEFPECITRNATNAHECWIYLLVTQYNM